MEKREKSFEARIKQKTFDDIYQKIVPLIEHENYEAVQHTVKSELLSLTQTLGGQEPIEKRIRDLRIEFEKALPEDMKPYIKYLHPDSMAGKGMRREKHAAEMEAAGARKKPESQYRFEHEGGIMEKPTRVALRLDQLKRGLVIDIKDLQTQIIASYEFLGEPKPDDRGDLWVVVRNTNTYDELPMSLISNGIIANKDGQQSPRYYVVHARQTRKPGA